MIRRLTVLAIVSLIIACNAVAQGTRPAKAPSVGLKDLDGKRVNLSDYRGRIVLVNFWATWCVPCVAEVPELVKWQEEFKDQLQVLGVTYPPTSLVKVRNFVRKNKINYPILLGSKVTKKLFEPSDNLPITIVIDADGYIVARIVGVVFVDEFDAAVRPLLRPK